jgi:hypothetical protein
MVYLRNPINMAKAKESYRMKATKNGTIFARILVDARKPANSRPIASTNF